jgi:hypothetical protein
MHLEKTKMHLMLFLLISLSLSYFLGCKTVSNESKKNDSSLISLNIKATGENQEPIDSFKIRINSNKELTASQGQISVRLAPGVHHLSVSADGRLPKHFEYPIIKSKDNEEENGQSVDIFLPSLSKTKTYRLNSTEDNEVGYLTEDSEWGINVGFPVGSLPNNANFKMYALSVDKQEDYYTHRPGSYQVVRNGSLMQANSLLTSYFQLTNDNGSKVNLAAPVKVYFKLLSNKQLPNLYLSSYNESTNQWEAPREVTYDPVTNLYSSYVEHFSWYDLLQPIEPDTIKKITVKVANFPPALPSAGTQTVDNSDERTKLLRIYSQYFIDMKNNAFKDDAEREAKKNEINKLLQEFAEKEDLDALAQEAQNYSDVPTYAVQEEASYRIAANQVPNVAVQIQSIKLGVAVRQERALTDANGEVVFALDPDATYIYLKAVHKISNTKGIFAQPQVMDVDDLTNEGVVHINLNDYPEISFKDGDYTYFF